MWVQNTFYFKIEKVIKSKMGYYNIYMNTNSQKSQAP